MYLRKQKRKRKRKILISVLIKQLGQEVQVGTSYQKIQGYIYNKVTITLQLQKQKQKQKNKKKITKYFTTERCQTINGK